MARRRVALLASFLCAGTGCSAPAPPPTTASPRDPLVGVWDLTLTLTEPKPGAVMPAERERRAVVALIPTASPARGADYLGLYDADLTWLGIHPFVIGDPPRATASFSSRSVRLVLNDTVDFGRVVLDGRPDGTDRITGSWEVTDIRRGARGRFTMRPTWPRVDPAAQDGVTGVWQLTLRVERPGGEGTAVVGTGLRATVVLAPRAPPQKVADEFAHFARATHVGLHSADLRPIGVRSRGTMRLPSGQVLEWPPVAAARVTGDAVAIELNPDSDSGAVLLGGRMRQDRIEGRWGQMSSGQRNGDGARGTFAMERISVIESRHRQD